MRKPEDKILDRTAMRAEAKRLRETGIALVFTNGCFDLFHAGHAAYLHFARRQGDRLAVGLNSDASVRRAKGKSRPVVPQQHRARMLAALECVDYVVVFDEAEPADLIREISPKVLVKGEDWAHYVSGRDWVESQGGKVVLAPLVPGLSTTELYRRIRAGLGADAAGSAGAAKSGGCAGGASECPKSS